MLADLTLPFDSTEFNDSSSVEFGNCLDCLLNFRVLNLFMTLSLTKLPVLLDNLRNHSSSNETADQKTESKERNNIYSR